VCAQTHSVVVLGRSGVDVGRGPVRRQRKCSRPCPLLVHGLPARPVDGRVPARQRLGTRRQVSAPNADGWRKILPRQEAGPVDASDEPRRGLGLRAQARKIPVQLRDKCFNCLSYSHRVATCRLPRRCLRCHGFGHLARNYKQPKSTLKGGGLPRHSARADNPPASQHAPRGSPPTSDGTAQGGVGCADGSRRRWRRHRRHRGQAATDISMGAPVDYTGDASASTAARCFLEPDPLAEALCVGAGPPAGLVLIDPMLDELAASLVVSRPAVAPALGCLHAAATVSQEVQASLVDTCSPVMIPQGTTDLPPSSPVQGSSPLIGEPVVAGDVALGEDGEV
jgi:hypothetical protein